MVANLDIRKKKNILAILNLHAAPIPSTKFPLRPTFCSGADSNWRISRWQEEVVKIFKMADMAAILVIGTEWF